MAVFQVIATSLNVSGTEIIICNHQHPTLADAVAKVPRDSFCYLQCNSLMPHDFSSHLQTLLRGQDVLDTLELRAAPVNTQDQGHTLDITDWQMVALRALHVYGFVPRGLGKFHNGMGNEFSNLTTLTLGGVDGLYPQTTVADFFAAVKTWRNLQTLKIEHYSKLMHDPTDLPNDFACLQQLTELTLTDGDPAWISKFLTYTDTPHLVSLYLHTAFNLVDGNPGACAATLTSWLPQSEELEQNRIFSMLGGVRKVQVHMAENEYRTTRIVGASDQGSPFLTLEVTLLKPVGMNDDTWRARHLAWSRSADALGRIIFGLPRLFPSEDVHTLELNGDFEGVLAGHWSAPLRRYQGLLHLQIDARVGNGVDELFGALVGVDEEGRDLVCSNLGNVKVVGARYSKAFFARMVDTLEVRREAQLAVMQLYLVGTIDEYVRDFPHATLMKDTGLDAVVPFAVGSFNLRISDWRGINLFSYGG